MTVAATHGTTKAPPTTTVSDCSWDGNGCNYKTAENGNAATKPNENGTRMERGRNDGRQGGDNGEEARQTKKGPRDIV